MQQTKKEIFYTIAEVSEMFQMDRHQVYNLIYDGRLKAYRLTPRKTLIKQSDLMQFVSDNEVKAG